jgi:hypothetical protein
MAAAFNAKGWCVHEEGVMTHDTQYQVQRFQQQKQRQQQQLQQELRSKIAPSSRLPEKEHQSKHNPVSDASQDPSHSSDQ